MRKDGKGRVAVVAAEWWHVLFGYASWKVGGWKVEAVDKRVRRMGLPLGKVQFWTC